MNQVYKLVVLIDCNAVNFQPVQNQKPQNDYVICPKGNHSV